MHKNNYKKTPPIKQMNNYKIIKDEKDHNKIKINKNRWRNR